MRKVFEHPIISSAIGGVITLLIGKLIFSVWPSAWEAVKDAASWLGALFSHAFAVPLWMLVAGSIALVSLGWLLSNFYHDRRHRRRRLGNPDIREKPASVDRHQLNDLQRKLLTVLADKANRGVSLGRLEELARFVEEDRLRTQQALEHLEQCYFAKYVPSVTGHSGYRLTSLGRDEALRLGLL